MRMLKGLEYAIGNTEDLRSDIIRYTRLLRRLDERIEFHLVCLKCITEEREMELSETICSSLVSEGLSSTQSHDVRYLSLLERKKTSNCNRSLGIDLPQPNREGVNESVKNELEKIQWMGKQAPRRRLEGKNATPEELRKCKSESTYDHQFANCANDVEERKALHQRQLLAISTALKESMSMVHPSWQDAAVVALRVPDVKEIHATSSESEQKKKRRREWSTVKAEAAENREELKNHCSLIHVDGKKSSKMSENEAQDEKNSTIEKKKSSNRLELMFKPHVLMIRRLVEEKSWLLNELVAVSRELQHHVCQHWASLVNYSSS